MDAWTHTLGLDDADSCLPRVRETRTRYVGAATTVTRVEPRLEPRRTAAERAGLRSHANRIRSSLTGHAETVLFAVTLAAIGYLYLGALLAQAL